MQVLPDGTAWIPNLVKEITDVILNGSDAITVDQKLIDGPNPNDQGKFFIPLILAFQVSFFFGYLLTLANASVVLQEPQTHHPLHLLPILQYFVVVKLIKGAIKNDTKNEKKPLWELRDMGLANRKF